MPETRGFPAWSNTIRDASEASAGLQLAHDICSRIYPGLRPGLREVAPLALRTVAQAPLGLKAREAYQLPPPHRPREATLAAEAAEMQPDSDINPHHRSTTHSASSTVPSHFSCLRCLLSLVTAASRRVHCSVGRPPSNAEKSVYRSLSCVPTPIDRNRYPGGLDGRSPGQRPGSPEAEPSGRRQQQERAP